MNFRLSELRNPPATCLLELLSCPQQSDLILNNTWSQIKILLYKYPFIVFFSSSTELTFGATKSHDQRAVALVELPEAGAASSVSDDWQLSQNESLLTSKHGVKPPSYGQHHRKHSKAWGPWHVWACVDTWICVDTCGYCQHQYRYFSTPMKTQRPQLVRWTNDVMPTKDLLLHMLHFLIHWSILSLITSLRIYFWRVAHTTDE